MKDEIFTAVMFFSRFIERSETFPRDQLENFKKYLTELLIERFEKHWFPQLPTKGQAYRCIRVNCVSPVDFTLELAAVKCGLRYSDLRLPTELTVWVDPNEVCYRLGESQGSCCTLATFSSDSSSESSTSSPSNSPPSTPLQEKPNRVQKPTLQRYYTPEFSNKYRSLSNPSYRMKTSQREMNFYYNHNRQMYRSDGFSYPTNPALYRNMNYNRTHHKIHKNALRV